MEPCVRWGDISRRASCVRCAPTPGPILLPQRSAHRPLLGQGAISRLLQDSWHSPHKINLCRGLTPAKERDSSRGKAGSCPRPQDACGK